MSELRIGILTCSDSRGEAEDTAGRALSGLIAERGWALAGYQVVPDDRLRIESALIEMADGADVILTCGGTGLGPRDVTPEATLAVCDRPVPGIAEHIRAESLKVTGRAMLSRGTAAARGRTLVVNLPGSEKAARECFGFIADQFEHAAKMMHGGGH
ncbi:MAG: MogA/MoaB family molybdenum cofactor biosynthesis protein [Coriobacteriia bacterium]|nr:MogA/MoaB family molybdenum cofactor biosynthesis protein [Coriobacteriia bacterium]